MKVQWQASNFLKYLLSIVDQYSHPSKTGSPGIVNFLSGTVQGTGTLDRVSSYYKQCNQIFWPLRLKLNNFQMEGGALNLLLPKDNQTLRTQKVQEIEIEI